MAIHVSAEIIPGKLELLQAWVPDQPWLGGLDTSNLIQLGSYRFDDPAGEVGIETHLLGTADGKVLQVPLTYRGAPRMSGEATLITTMTHTVLGDRWVYDGCSDPVYATALAEAILTGGHEADLFLSSEAGLVVQPTRTHVRGSGSPGAQVPDLRTFAVTHDGPVTRMSGTIALTLHRIPSEVAGTATLTGTWPGQERPRLLAAID